MKLPPPGDSQWDIVREGHRRLHANDPDLARHEEAVAFELLLSLNECDEPATEKP